MDIALAEPRSRVIGVRVGGRATPDEANDIDPQRDIPPQERGDVLETR